jgi:hypothetical protein
MFGIRSILGGAFMVVSCAHAQSVDHYLASGFESNCPAPNNRGVPFVLRSTAEFATFFNAPFPGTPNSEVFNPSFSPGEAVAFRFIAPAAGLVDGRFESFSVGNGEALTSISECPGVFGAALNIGSRVCDGGKGKPMVEWTAPLIDLAQSASRCLLIPGRTYYLNIGVNNCSGVGGCGVRTRVEVIQN